MQYFKADLCSVLYLVRVKHDLGTRIEIAQHGSVAGLNRLVNRN